MATAADVKKVAQDLLKLSDLMGTWDALSADVSRLTAQKGQLETQIAQSKSDLDQAQKTATTAFAKTLAQQEAQRVAHEKRIADLSAQEGPLQARLTELRGQIEATAKNAQAKMDKEVAEQQNVLANLSTMIASRKGELAGLEERFRDFHAKLGAVVTAR